MLRCFWLLLHCYWDPAPPGRGGRDGRCHLHTPRFHHRCPALEPRTPPRTQSVPAEGGHSEHIQKTRTLMGFVCACTDGLPAGTKWWRPLCVWHPVSSLHWRQGWRPRRADLHTSLQAGSHESLRSEWGHHALSHPGEHKQKTADSLKSWQAAHRISQPVWWHHHKRHWRSSLTQPEMKSKRIIMGCSVMTVADVIVWPQDPELMQQGIASIYYPGIIHPDHWSSSSWSESLTGPHSSGKEDKPPLLLGVHQPHPLLVGIDCEFSVHVHTENSSFRNGFITWMESVGFFQQINKPTLNFNPSRDLVLMVQR